jgi:hypothetical protein
MSSQSLITIALNGTLAGAVLGFNFELYGLVLTICASVLLTVLVGAAGGAAAPSIASFSSLIVFTLQIGYLVGCFTQFVSARKPLR